MPFAVACCEFGDGENRQQIQDLIDDAADHIDSSGGFDIAAEDIVDVNIITEESAYEMLNRPNQTNVMNEIMKNHLVLIGVENFYNILKKWKNDK